MTTSSAKNADGTVTTVGDDHVMRFERHLKHPIEKVWDALTKPEVIKDWLADGGGEIELRVGGRVHLIEHGESFVESTVTDLDPPRSISYEFNTPKWDGGSLRWDLETADGGTRLVLTHRVRRMSAEEQRSFAAKWDLPEGWELPASTLAGWHSILDRLPAALDGEPVEGSMDEWRKLNERYKKVDVR